MNLKELNDLLVDWKMLGQSQGMDHGCDLMRDTHEMIIKVRSEIAGHNAQVIKEQTGRLRHAVQDFKNIIPHLEDIVYFESGEMSEATTIAFFQDMIDSGVVWEQPAFYGRMATKLIEAGICTKGIKEQAE